MTNLQKNALSRDVLTATRVEELYRGSRWRWERELCESHERLRMELDKVRALIDGPAPVEGDQ